MVLEVDEVERKVKVKFDDDSFWICSISFSRQAFINRVSFVQQKLF